MLKLYSIALAILFSCILSVNSKSLSSNDVELVFAHVIFRHGERNIVKTYPTDPYKDESNWPGGFGALTNKGKSQLYELGKYLRKHYSEILSTKYSSNEIYVRSTDTDRTLMSAQAVLAGLYPPIDDEIWNKRINWQPVPVHTIPLKEDYLLISIETSCPRFNEIFDRFVKESELARDVHAKVAELSSDLSNKSGLNITSLLDTYLFVDALYVQHLHNKTLPDWAYGMIEPNGVLDKVTKFMLIQDSETPELARLTSGFLLKEMLERFSQKVNSTLNPNRSLWLYSAHDYTMTNFLNSLGLYEVFFVKHHYLAFASSIHFELYKSAKDGHYIQVSYKHSENEDPVPMKIPKCGEKCPLDRFNEIYSGIIPGDRDVECRSSSNSEHLSTLSVSNDTAQETNTNNVSTSAETKAAAQQSRGVPKDKAGIATPNKTLKNRGSKKSEFLTSTTH